MRIEIGSSSVLVSIPGIYLPQYYRPRMEQDLQVGVSPYWIGLPPRVVRGIGWNRKSHFVPTRSCMMKSPHLRDMALMEVTRGCIWACRFCTAGFIYRPPRLPDLEKTYSSLDTVLTGVGKSAKTIGLVGPSCDRPSGPSSTGTENYRRGQDAFVLFPADGNAHR